MTTIAKALTALAALAFVLAVVSSFAGPLLQTSPEAYSRACSNLALLAIAVSLIFGDRTIVGRSAPLS